MTTQNVETIIKTLIKNYLKGSLLFSITPEDAELMTWRNQKVFLDNTIHSELLNRYPVKIEFAKLFLKKLISSIEPYQEVHDDFYHFLCQAMKKESTDMFCYRHYIINDNIQNIITIKETNNMVVNGTTGMRTWEAALILADWALCNKDIFLNKKILELGSGVGFTGITIAKNCEVESIILSDCHDDVLKAIRENISINFSDSIRITGAGRRNRQINIDVLMLDWNDHGQIPNELVPDVVIGADIVYDPSILHSLCNVLLRLFKKNIELEVYIASMIRNEDTFNEFLRILEINDFAFVKVLIECSKFIDWDYNNKQRCLLKILRRNKEEVYLCFFIFSSLATSFFNSNPCYYNWVNQLFLVVTLSYEPGDSRDQTSEKKCCNMD